MQAFLVQRRHFAVVLLLLGGVLSPSLQAPLRSRVSPAKHANALLASLQDYELTYPSRVDGRGSHISYDLKTAGQEPHKRDTSADDESIYFRVDVFGETFILNVTTNEQLVSSNMVVEYIGENGSRLQQPSHTGCYHTGHVFGGSAEGWTAVSSCQGLHGVIATNSGYYFIEPLQEEKRKRSAAQQHVVYRNTPKDGHTCIHEESSEQEKPIVPAEMSSQRRQRSVVREHYIETTVVADRSMLQHHGVENLESYLFTLMNVVSRLYRDPTIGNAVNVVVVRTLILETDQPSLSLSSNAQRSLENFCQWQHGLRNGPHHDIALLVTRQDICERLGVNCGTLGMSAIGGVCDPLKSCNINEDSGLSTAFTIAHEIGHNLGLRHDGNPSVGCHPDRHFLMAPSFAASLNPHQWSQCSQQQIEAFFASTSSECLNNAPDVLSSGAPLLAGMEYSATEQCQLLLGPNATHCPRTENECRLLWCRMEDGECFHRHVPPASGTECTLSSGELGVCYQGECMEYSMVIEPVDGGWGDWGEWGECSLSCGTGVQYSERECDSPIPTNGGSYCLGLRRRYRTCNTQPCEDTTGFRQQLCETDPPVSQFAHWDAPSLEFLAWSHEDPCEHHCIERHSGTLYTKMIQLPNGAPCIATHVHSLGVCVEGECVPVGCDHQLNSSAHRDVCGVWCGDGSTCERVSGTYASVSHPEYRYYEAVLIPKGSANIVIEESLFSPPTSYIAARSHTSKINMDFNVLWSALSSHWFAGSGWWYERPGNAPEYLRTEGPITENITVFLLAKVQDAGIRYTFTRPRDTMFNWNTSDWVECEGVCGDGVQRREVTCVGSGGVGEVNESRCDAHTKPAETQSCNPGVCQWTTSEWTECDVTCGRGSQSRSVSCQRVRGNGDTVTIADSHCDPDSRPTETQECEMGSCHWVTSEWTECDALCGEGSRHCTVSCQREAENGSVAVVDDSYCDQDSRPTERQACQAELCNHFHWRTSEWAECDADCGEGTQSCSLSCQHQNGTTVPNEFCVWEPPPPTSRTCTVDNCVEESDCEDSFSANFCAVIARYNYCRYYSYLCCRSCSLS